MKTALMIVTMLFMFAVGTGCLFFPARVQAMNLRRFESGSLARDMKGRAYVASDRYRWDLRLVGVSSYAAALLLAFGLWKGTPV
jgi:hypothetical protein